MTPMPAFDLRATSHAMLVGDNGTVDEPHPRRTGSNTAGGGWRHPEQRAYYYEHKSRFFKFG